MSTDASTEFGKFAGSFIVTTVAGIFDKILGRKNDNDKEIVESIKDWKFLIDELSNFKEIHNFMQNFVDHSGVLFHDQGGRTILKTGGRGSIKKIERSWKDQFDGQFGTDFDSLKRLMSYFGKAIVSGDSISSEEVVNGIFERHKKRLDPATRKAVRNIGGVAQKTLVRASELIQLLDNEKVNVSQLSQMNQDQLQKIELEMATWEFSTKGTAGSSLGLADTTMLNLIQILSFLYNNIMGYAK